MSGRKLLIPSNSLIPLPSRVPEVCLCSFLHISAVPLAQGPKLLMISLRARGGACKADSRGIVTVWHWRRAEAASQLVIDPPLLTSETSGTGKVRPDRKCINLQSSACSGHSLSSTSSTFLFHGRSNSCRGYQAPWRQSRAVAGSRPPVHHSPDASPGPAGGVPRCGADETESGWLHSPLGNSISFLCDGGWKESARAFLQ